MSSKFFGNSKEKQPTKSKGKNLNVRTNTNKSSGGVKKAGRGK